MYSSQPKIHVKSITFPPDQLKIWKLEGEFVSCLSTIDFLVKANELGDIPPEIFHRQIKTLLKGAIQSRIELEKISSFNFEAFINNLNLTEIYPNGMNLLKRADGTDDISEATESVSKINYAEITKLPTKAADFVAASIELLDLLRLADIATVDRLLPLLDEIRAIFSVTTLFGNDFWATKETEEWIRVLNKRRPGTLLPKELAEKLELQAVRWLNTFRRELKNI